MKKIIGLLIFAIIMTAAVFAADYTVQKDYVFSSNSEKVKVLGRGEVTSQGAICDWSASGIELNLDCSGDVFVKVTNSASCYFHAYVDGVIAPERIYVSSAGETTIKIAEGLAPGIHNIRVLKSSFAANAISTFTVLTVNGELLAAPPQKEVYIEFIGDSFFGGSGVLGDNSMTNGLVYHDAALSAPVLIADALGADFSDIAQGGSGMVKSYNATIIPNVYEYTCPFRSSTELYSFSRIPDIIFVKLGLNDSGLTVTTAEYKTAALAFITKLMTKNPGAKIIYSQDTPKFAMQVREVVNELGGAAAGLYTMEFPVTARSGVQNHPNIAEQQYIAEKIVEEIRRLNFDVFGTLENSYSFKADISGGGTATLDYSVNGTSTSGVASISETLDVGTEVTITAVPAAGSKFLYFIDTETNRILSTEALTLSVGGAVSVRAVVIPDKAAAPQHYVTFFDFNRKVVWSGTVDDGADAIAPTLAANYFGYAFKGWSTSITNVKGDLTVRALYEKLDKEFAIRVFYGDTLSDTLARTFDSAVTVDISGNIPSGKYFAGWSFDYGRTVASYDESYTFYAAGDMTVVALFSDTPKTAVPTVTLLNNHFDYNGVSYIMSRNLPAGYTCLESGIIYTKIAYGFINIGHVNGKTVKVGRTANTSASGQYQLNILTSSGTVYAAAFLKYKDSLGKSYIIYSPVIPAAIAVDTNEGIIDQGNGELSHGA